MNKHCLITILKALSTIEIDIHHGNFTPKELWEWLLFDKENSYLNNTLKIHQPSGIPIEGRNTLISDKLTIQGQFLLLTFIGHSPSYSLHKLNTQQELAIKMLSRNGILNMFTTIQIPIIKGQIPNLDPLKKIKEKYHIPPTSVERKLIDTILPILITKIDFYPKVEQCRTIIITHKNLGITQQQAYDTLHIIKIIFQTVQIENLDDTIDELLDYICGYLGNKEKWIWNKRL